MRRLGWLSLAASVASVLVILGCAGTESGNPHADTDSGPAIARDGGFAGSDAAASVDAGSTSSDAGLGPCSVSPSWCDVPARVTGEVLGTIGFGEGARLLTLHDATLSLVEVDAAHLVAATTELSTSASGAAVLTDDDAYFEADGDVVRAPFDGDAVTVHDGGADALAAAGELLALLEGGDVTLVLDDTSADLGLSEVVAHALVADGEGWLLFTADAAGVEVRSVDAELAVGDAEILVERTTAALHVVTARDGWVLGADGYLLAEGGAPLDLDEPLVDLITHDDGVATLHARTSGCLGMTSYVVVLRDSSLGAQLAVDTGSAVGPARLGRHGDALALARGETVDSAFGALCLE